MGRVFNFRYGCAFAIISSRAFDPLEASKNNKYSSPRPIKEKSYYAKQKNYQT
jgi:hypothetical protein